MKGLRRGAETRPRWRLPRPRRRGGGGVGGGVLWARAKSFRSAKRSSESLEPAPSVPSPTATPARARSRVREDAADRELHVGDRVGDDGAAALGDQRQLLVVEPDAVGEHRALVEQPQAGRGRRPGAAPCSATQSSTSCSVSERWIWIGSSRSAAELGDPAQRALADRVDRVRGEGRGDRAAPTAGQLVEAADGAVSCIASVSPSASKSGPPTVARRPASAHGPRGRLRVPVHVPEAGRAGADHLQAGEPGAPVDVVGLELGLDRPDPSSQPGHQRQVAAVAAEEGHRRVGVAVDEWRRRAAPRRRRSSRRRAAA